MKPLISIVIPVYNLQDYIEKTLDSVFSQTYKNIEVIAVNDGSKDNSAHILNEYAKKEIRLKVIHKENGGVTKARITGIKAASGEYIGFVDGDDLIDADMYERLMYNLLKYNADISHCGYRVITEQNIKYYYNSGKCVIQNNHTGVKDLLEGVFIEPGLWNKLFKKELFNKLFEDNKLNISLVINEDLLMNYFLFRYSQKSVYEDFCPYQYIKRQGSASQSNTRLIDFEHPIRVRQEIVKDCLGTPEEELAYKIYISKTLHKISEIFDNKNSEFADLKEEMIDIVKCNKERWKTLSFKQRISAYMLIYAKPLYKCVDKIYRHYITKEG